MQKICIKSVFKLKTMKKLYVWSSTLMFALVIVFLPSSCTLPWASEDDEFNITSKFKATWNIHEKMDNHSDGSITYHSVQWGGLVGLVKEHNLPVDWSRYESVTFEFEDSTKVETQILLAGTLRAWGRKGIMRLPCYFDGVDVRQIDQVVLQTAKPTTLTIKRVMLSPATTSWDSKPIWEGECVFGNWEGGFVIKPEQFSTAIEGDKLEFVFTTDCSDPKRTYWQIKTVYNTTSNTLEGNYNEQNDWGCAQVGQTATTYRIVLTAKDVKQLKKVGLFVNGYYVNVTQVNLLRKGVNASEEGSTGEVGIHANTHTSAESNADASENTDADQKEN